MTKDSLDMLNRLQNYGISYDDSLAIRRIAMTLHSWDEKECGNDYGCIERDEETGKTYWLNAMTSKRFPIPDRETGATKRLNKIMENYPELIAYHQGDPRGASLYIIKKSDIGDYPVDSVYNRGVAVYK